MAWEPTDKEKFDKFYLAGLGDDQLGRNFSSTRDKVQKYLGKRYEEGTLPRRGTFEPTSDIVTDDLDQLHLSILKKLKGANVAISVIDIANDFDVSPKKVEEVITKLGGAGYLVGLEYGHVKFAPPQAGLRSRRHFEYMDKTRTIRFGVMGDAHLCSKYSRLDHLNTYYDICEQEGVTRVFDCGNMIDGEARFNKTDLLVHGLGNQMKFWAEHWPKRDGITTEYICGDDHEGWYLQREGIDIGWHMQKVAEQAGRDDLKYLGYMEHDVDLVTPEGGVTKLRLQHPGGGCFDENAEILTRGRGWVKFSDLTENDYVATMEKASHEFQWQKPTRVVNQPYSGELIHFKSRTFECRVTPDHKFMTRRYNTYRGSLKEVEYPQKARHHFTPDWVIMTADEIASTYHRQRYQFPTTAAGWKGKSVASVTVPRLEPVNPHNSRNASQMQHIGEIAMEDAAELIAWFVTEGSATKKTVSICQCRLANPHNHERICSLLNRLGIRYNVSGHNDKNISIGSVELSKWLTDECGSGSRHKRLPEWLKDQESRVLGVVLDVLISGDGWVNGSSYVYKSISPRLRADVVEIAQKLGIGSVANKDTVTLRKIQNEPTLNVNPTREPYSGNVYCCEVPNGMILVKCFGKVFWSHNSAYATSYQPQKIVESWSSGEKPHILCLGHYHKHGSFMVRGVNTLLVGCFTGNTHVQTETGPKRICRIQVGDRVLTHTGTYKPVKEVYTRRHYGDLITIHYGRRGCDGTRLTATPEHPILIERDGKKEWTQLGNVVEGDWVFVLPTSCTVCGEKIPHYMKMCRNCNPMHTAANREKLSKSKGGFKKRRKNGGSGLLHLEKDILPFCESMRQQGWRIVPIGADVIPDAVGFKDGKVVAFELESRKGNLLSFKQRKYSGRPIESYLDEIQWIPCGPQGILQPRGDYEADPSGFVRVKVVSTRSRKAGGPKRTFVTVWNFAVEEDESYVANKVVVHNCFQDQTPFMRKKRLSAHLGGYICDLTQAPDGSVLRWTTTFIPFFSGDNHEVWQYKMD